MKASKEDSILGILKYCLIFWVIVVSITLIFY